MSAPKNVIGGRFHVQKPLGEGAWGKLFVAEYRSKGALKNYLPLSDFPAAAGLGRSV